MRGATRCWPWGQAPLSPPLEPAVVALGEPARPLLSWPLALRQVQGWLDPWTMLWRYWRAWSSAPPPPALQALLDAVGSGHPLHLSLLF